MLISTRQAAKRLGVTDRRVRHLIAQGRIKSFKVAGSNLIEEKDCYFERLPRGRKTSEGGATSHASDH
ncbi:MAG: helix-turn-helix domain-containing protein [Dehalococcoidia bacterium]